VSNSLVNSGVDLEAAMYPGNESTVQTLSYLLDEYKYRHDLIWRLLFQITLVVVVLSYVPYLQYGTGSVATTFGAVVLTLPALAAIIAGYSIRLMAGEFDLFWTVVVPYHLLQKYCFDKTFAEHPEVKPFVPDKKEHDRFRRFVVTFLWVLLVLAVLNLAVVSGTVVRARAGVGRQALSLPYC
jgi:lysylphosphatidylglycerol synthetase-like protein (DUF2156 family)